jgi:hypothetical protein
MLPRRTGEQRHGSLLIALPQAEDDRTASVAKRQVVEFHGGGIGNAAAGEQQ